MPARAGDRSTTVADPLPELDDIPEDDDALHVPDHVLQQALEDGRPWSEDDDEDTVPDDLDDDGEDG